VLITVFVLVLAGAGVALSRALGGRHDRGFLVFLFVAAFGLRISFALFLTQILPDWVVDHPNLSLGFLGDDGRLYHQLAIRSVEAWGADRSALPEFVAWQGASGYILLHALIFRVFGPDLLAMGAFNAFLGALVPVFTYEIARRAFSEPAARLSALMVALYPEQIVYSGSNLKDISVTAALMIGVWAGTRLQESGEKRHSFRHAAVLGLLGAYLALARFYLVPVLAGALLLNPGGARKGGVGGTVRRVLAVSVLLALASVLLAQIFPRSIVMFQDPVSEMSGFYGRMVRPRAGSIYALMEPPLSFIFLPFGILLVMVTPLPLWAVLSPEPTLYVLLPGMVAWYLVLPFVAYGMWVSRGREGSARMLLFLVVGVLVLLAASGSGLVTTGRTRLPIQPLLLMFAAAGIREWLAGRRMAGVWAAGYTVAISATMMVYVWLR
jgi:hypothetical protein